MSYLELAQLVLSRLTDEEKHALILGESNFLIKDILPFLKSIGIVTGINTDLPWGR